MPLLVTLGGFTCRALTIYGSAVSAGQLGLLSRSVHRISISSAVLLTQSQYRLMQLPPSTLFRNWKRLEQRVLHKRQGKQANCLRCLYSVRAHSLSAEETRRMWVLSKLHVTVRLMLRSAWYQHVSWNERLSIALESIYKGTRPHMPKGRAGRGVVPGSPGRG